MSRDVGYDNDAPAESPGYPDRGMRVRPDKDHEPVSVLLDQISDELAALQEQIEKHIHVIDPVLRPEQTEDAVRGDLARIRLNSVVGDRLVGFRQSVRDARLTLGHATERIDL